MKKIVSFVLALIIVLPAFNSFAAPRFSDVSESHWAYSSVERLVSRGTINGFEDGTFRPDAVVSRAEFVKMIGKGPSVASTSYVDVLPDSWYYDYVMTSGLEPINKREFMPDEPITRNDVAQLLWQRNGRVKLENAPCIITSQGKNPDAAAWVYAKGIMVGDDYIDLRLNDSLTRSEAAALIVRTEENVSVKNADFISNISDTVLKNVYDSLNLFDDKPYSPEAKVTHGELAHMAMRLACGQHQVTYGNFSCNIPFEHKYAQSLDVYGNYCIGADKINEKYIDENATVADAVCAVAFGLVKTSRVYLNYGQMNNYYKDVETNISDTENKHLTMAYNSGISLYADGTINADKDVTLRELACLLLEADSISGFNVAYVYSDKESRQNYPLGTNAAQYSANGGRYAVLLKDIPDDVYGSDYVLYGNGNGIGVPAAMYNSVRDFSEIYTKMVKTIASVLNENGEKVNITFYPSMVVNNGDGCTFRVKMECIDVTDNISLGELIPIADNIDDITLSDGMTLYVDLETGSKLKDIFYDASTAGINKIVKIQN